ncbi:unnamed protein product [Heligmosomoides polygyrus]|uniref:Reverse transcriptase domain-containing protein n=1 Tax=Heligmosomoides polygyrus TaxID=6339 RepID=A0A183G0Q2_HELPZ|nr:unnamed protein product [Heligmosomoides polygyrus]
MVLVVVQQPESGEVGRDVGDDLPVVVSLTLHLFTLYKKGDICNHRLTYLLSVVCKLFTRVILNRISRKLDEGQPCEQSEFRREFSTIEHTHTRTMLIEVSREYKLPLCLTFINLKKALGSVETKKWRPGY